MTKLNESWVNNRWRPALGWTYMAICLFDFIIAPLIIIFLQIHTSGSIGTLWKPLTSSDGGLFHMAMGAVLGVAAWTRGQEKITSLNNKSKQEEE